MAANSVSNLKDVNTFSSWSTSELAAKEVSGGAAQNEPSKPNASSRLEAPTDENSALPSLHTNNAGTHEAPPQLPAILPVADEEANTELLARYDRLTRHREKILTLRMNLDYELSRLDDCRRFFSEAVETLMKHHQDSLTGPPLPPAEAMIQVKRDYDVLEEQNRLVTRLGQALSEREYKLARLEGHFCRKARQVLGTMFPEKNFNIPRAFSEARRDDHSEESSEVPTSVNMDPLLQEYFEVAGRVGVYGERLVELDFEYKDELTQRNLREDQELPVDPPEHEFEQQYQDQRMKIESDLSRSMLQMENLRQSCIQRGLDPDETRKASSGGQSSYVTSAVSSEISAVPSRDLNEVFEALAGPDLGANHYGLRLSLLTKDAPEEIGQLEQSEVRLNLDLQRLNRAKIEGWRETVERSDPEVGDSHRTELEPVGGVQPVEHSDTTMSLENVCAPQSPNHDEGYGSHSQHGSVGAPHEHIISPTGHISPPSTVIRQRIGRLDSKEIDHLRAMLPARHLLRKLSDPELQRRLMART